MNTIVLVTPWVRPRLEVAGISPANLGPLLRVGIENVLAYARLIGKS